MSRRNATALVIGLLAVASVLFGAVGGAAAADVGIVNETVSVDSETRSVYADLNVTQNVSTNASFTVEFVGLDSDGNVTGTLDTRNVTVDSGNTSLVEYTSVNASAYSEVRVTVMLDNSTASTENVSASVGKLQEVAASGGGSGSGFSLDSLGMPAVVVLLLGGLFLFGREDE